MAAQLFDAFSGALTPAAEILLRWSMPTLLTSKPLEQWGEIEWALDRRGFSVLPISRAGLAALMSNSIGAPAEQFLSNAEQPRLSRYERNPRRLLERDSPSDADIEQLCTELRKEFGERGFAWVAACAAYPEIHWGITLRLGAALVPDDADQGRILPRMARLAWFRDGFMPDWVRKALLERISPDDEATTRALLHQVLASLSGVSSQEVPLRIALEAPPAKSWARSIANNVRDFFARRRIWQKSERVIQSAPPESPLRDHVFLRFISGSSFGKLSLSAPGTLLKLLFRGGSPLLGFQPLIALLIVLIASAVIGVVMKPVHTGVESRYFVRSAVTESGSVLSVYAYLLEPTPDDPEKVVSAGFIESFPDGRNTVRENFDLGDAENLGLSPGGRYLLLTSGEHFRVMETSSGEVVAEADTICEDNSKGCIQFSGNEEVLAWGVNKLDPTISIETLATGEGYSLAPKLLPGKLETFALSADGTRLAAGTSTGVFEVNLSNRAVTPVRPDMMVDRLIYGDLDRLLGINHRSTSGVWDVAANRQIAGFSGSASEIFNNAASETKPLLAIILDELDEDATIKLIDTANGISLDKLFVPPRNDYYSVTLARDGSQLAAGSLSGTLSVWSIPDGFPGPPRPGRSFALIFASSELGSQSETSVNDGRALAGVLRNRFGFGVTVLEYAADNSTNAVEAFRQLRANLEPQDRFLIFMSGSQVEYDQQLRLELSNLPVASVLVIVNDRDDRYLPRALSTQVGQIPGPVQELISLAAQGSPTAVSRAGYSPFATALIETLKSTNIPISARMLNDQMTLRLLEADKGRQRSNYTRFNEDGADDRREFQFPAPLTRAPEAPGRTPSTRPEKSPRANPPDTARTQNSSPQTLDDDITLTVLPDGNFPWQRLGGDPVSKNFEIRNGGPYRWNLSARIEGENSNYFRASTCEVIREKGLCAFSVSFDPRSEGQHQATLILSGSVERPQGTLSAKIQPIQLRAEVYDRPWRLGIRGNGQVTQDESSRSWNVPEIVFRATPGREGFAEIELRNPLDRPIKLAMSQSPQGDSERPRTSLGKNSCAGETISPAGSCYFTLTYLFPRTPAVSSMRRVQTAAPRPQPDVFTFYEIGDAELEPILRDRARIVVTTAGNPEAQSK